VRVLDEELIHMAAVSAGDIERATVAATEELSRQEARYRGERRFPDTRGKTVILVDDGLATGSTLRAAVQALRTQDPATIVVAVPVGDAETVNALRSIADDVVCIETPEPFRAVGLWYDDFSQTTDEEVHELLDRARHAGPITYGFSEGGEIMAGNGKRSVRRGERSADSRRESGQPGGGAGRRGGVGP